jgi:hypothetical protein
MHGYIILLQVFAEAFTQIRIIAAVYHREQFLSFLLLSFLPLSCLFSDLMTYVVGGWVTPGGGNFLVFCYLMETKRTNNQP